MQCYLVGGAVRDSLLGTPIQDRDYVVVGATPQQMIDAGFLPVGQSFPVFIHPLTGAEHALARTERKIALGYKGFTFYTGADVTLEQDLQRRDITINAMAQRVDQHYQPYGPIIDPYGGQLDLQNKILRHVSSAFIEDPVRVLRIARFAARFEEFSIAPETRGLMQQIVRRGEIEALASERVWQELSKGLMENHPYKMLEILNDCGALHFIFREFNSALTDQKILSGNQSPIECALQSAAQQKVKLAIRFAILMYFFCKIDDKKQALHLLQIFCQRLRIPKECHELAKIVLSQSDELMQFHQASPVQLVKLLYACDAWRRSARFDDILKTCTLINDTSFKGGDFFRGLQQAYLVACKIDISAIAVANAHRGPQAIAAAINEARAKAIEQTNNSHR